MDRKRLDEWCEKGILALTLCMLVAGPVALGATDTIEFVVVEGLGLGVFLLWAARLWVSPRPQFLWPPVCWSVLVFTGYAIVRYFQAEVEYPARHELKLVLLCAFLFFAIINNLHRQEHLLTISLTMVFLGMLIALYSLYQFATKKFNVWGYDSLYPGRASGTYISPNNLAGFLEMLVPLALAIVLAGRASHLLKVFVGYAAVVMLGGIAVTLSRGGYAATAVGLAALCGILLAQRGYRIQAGALLGALVLAAALMYPKLHDFQVRMQRAFAGHSEAQIEKDSRPLVWRAGYEMWLDHFWWGIGPGQFDPDFAHYRPVDLQRRPGQTHNDYLNTLVDYGLAGGLLAASALVFLGIGAARTWKALRGDQGEFSRPKGNRFAFLVGASAGLLALMAHSFVDFNMHVPANAILAVTLMALLASEMRFATDRFWLSAGMAGRMAATAVLIAGVVWLGCVGWRAAVENGPLKKGQATNTGSPSARAPYFEAAFAADPANSETAFEAGEAWRLISFEGNDHYESAASNAMTWFERGMKLNPHDEKNCRGYGICLDWIGKTNEAMAYFRRANELDPNGYFTCAWTGWHYFQVDDLAGARIWFERSIELNPHEENEIAIKYLANVDRELAARARRSAPANPPK